MEKVNPPKWILQFFRWFCAAELHPYIEGDLLELYSERLRSNGKRKADKRLLIDIIMLFRPSIIRPLKGYKYSNNNAMFKNYFKIAFRTLWKNKAYSLINIMGLAVSIAGATLLLTYVKSELSFDRFHTKSDQIVRPILIQSGAEGDRFFSSNPAIYAQTMAEQMPEVEQYVNLLRLSGQFNVVIDNKPFTERTYAIAPSNFFSVFDFELIQGNSQTVLNEPFSMVLSERQAIKFFGTVDVLGKTVEAPGYGGSFKITGLMRDLPQNTHIELDILIAEGTLPEDRARALYQNWTDFSSTSYIVLKKGADLTAFTAKANTLADSNFPKGVADLVRFEFQPLADIHFESAHIERDFAAYKGDKSYVIIFSVIALFLIVIAAVNYMNLATSKAVFRSKEIGIRKVVGAKRKQLVTQFLMESFLITGIAMLLSIGITDISMPFFNELTARSFEFNLQAIQDYAPLLLIIAISIGLLSGLYPAVFMTKFKPIKVLKGEESAGGSFNIRKVLVVFQFALSTVMIIGTLVVSNQMNFIQNKNLGFNKENLLVIDINNGAIRPVFKSMRNELEQIIGVSEVAVASRIPGEWKNINEVDVNILDERGIKKDSIETYYMSFDPHMLSVFNMELKEGEFFSGNDQSDSTKILINETAVKKFGLENPIGAIVELEGRGKSSYTIIGVLKDFNFQSLHRGLEPMVIGAWNNPNAVIDYFILKMEGDPKPIIEAASMVHSKFDTRTVIEYHFLDDQLANFYSAERQASVIFKIGAGLSIFISCLGLFGLASFTVQKRVKELGIRKVLGASEWSLFYMLSSSFSKQILLAFIIASPLAYFIMKKWLENFEYRIDLGVVVFFLAGLGTLLIAILTVSYRALQAAHSNPVHSLRSE
uniref:ABC transporter permease n=3 Tax=Roseivirga sp. TaxID=1964215 RepID=UPI0040489D07